MKKQLVFLSIILLFSGVITPVLGVTSARYKALWNQQVAKYRASKVVDTNQNLDSESEQNSEEEERTVTSAVQKDLDQVSQKKEKSFFQKYASKLAATLVGAAIVGAYEWFAKDNPELPTIGLGNMIDSMLTEVVRFLGFGFATDDEIAAEKVVVSDIPVDVPTHQSTTVSTPTVTTQPVISQPVRQSTTMPVAEELTTTAISTTSNTPVVQPVEQPKVIVENTLQPVDKGVAHVTSEDDSFETISVGDEDDSFKTLSFGEDKDVQNEAEVWSQDQEKVVLVSPKNIQVIEQPTVTINPDDKGAPLVSGEDDSVYYSLSSSEDESTEDEKKVVVQKPEPKNGDVQAVSSALDKLIAYATNTGNWFLNLFDTKNNTPYNQHVDTFGVLVDQMEKETYKVVGTDNPMLQATKDFASFLVRQLRDTYKTLDGNKKVSSMWSFMTPNIAKAAALGLALKNHVNDRVKEERRIAFQNIKKQFVGEEELDAKLIQLEQVMNGFGAEIEQKDEKTALNELAYRFGL